MNIVAIVSEYNPFHNGHKLQVDKVKKELNPDAIISIMSGNFVQRGEAAVLNKWERTKMALKGGVDLVLELPCIYALSSAEFFSYGAVSLMNSLNSVNYISFGSECGDYIILEKIAKILLNEPPLFKKILKEKLSEGLSFALARDLALNSFLQNDNIMSSKELLGTPNNILGIEYIKSLLKLNSPIKIHTVKREGASFKDENLYNKLSSATAIRKFINEGGNISMLQNNIPNSTLMGLQENKDNLLLSSDTMIKYLKYKSYEKGSMENLPDCNEGLENLIYKSLISSNSLKDVIMKTKSKRYAYSRISRLLCQYYIGFDNFNTKVLRKEPCPYGRILGFNQKGRLALKDITKNSSIPIYTKLPKIKPETLELDILSTKMYSLLSKNTSPLMDYEQKPIIEN